MKNAEFRMLMARALGPEGQLAARKVFTRSDVIVALDTACLSPDRRSVAVKRSDVPPISGIVALVTG